MLSPVVRSSMTFLLFSCLILLAQVYGEDVRKERASVRSRCPQGSYSYFSYCYALYATPATWMDAALNCQKQPSGYLTSVLSGSEASFVASLIKTNFNNYKNIWIGLHDPTEGQQPNGGGWQWASTDVMNYQAWEVKPSPNSKAYCGTVSQSSNYRKWREYNCDLMLPYVCKFKN
ncbi:lithostathine-like [Suncus etruscus]|uniref:lithostathine-like n=1 Tax=Suncus etruscus TaxID=109475 RepID=UPI002110634C|nr:lithostathine-like [Suncus etruscus]